MFGIGITEKGKGGSLRSSATKRKSNRNRLLDGNFIPSSWILNLGRLSVFLFVIIAWEVGARAGWIQTFFWSMPSEIMETWLRIAMDGSLWRDTFYTSQATIYGFLIGTTMGSMIGLSFWWSRYYAGIFEPYVIIFEAIPKLALAPIIILIFGLGISSKVAIAVAITFVITTLTTYSGVKRVDSDLVRMIYALGATRWQVFLKIVIPSTLPAIISALRINIGLALTGAVVGEYVGSKHGLGRMILHAGDSYRIDLIWAGVFNLSLLAIVLYLLVGWLENSLLKGILHHK